jgi:hypothetical protein
MLISFSYLHQSSLSNGDLRILVLNNCAVLDPFSFQAVCFCEELFPVINITLSWLNMNSNRCFIFLVEFDLNDGHRVKTFDFVTLVGVGDSVWLDCDSDVLLFFSAFIVVVHYIISFILLFGEFPLFFHTIILDELLDIIKNSAWFNTFGVNIISQNIVKGLVCESCLSY